MKNLLSEIQADINWRVSELATIKTLPFKYNMQEFHIQTLIWYSVPSIYAIWEGFIKNSFILYVDFINKKNLDTNNVDINIITHAIDIHCKLRDERVHFASKRDLINKIMEIFDNPFEISHEIPSSSNINYEVINQILERFNLVELDKSYKKRLDRLLFFRNHIAHGENSIKVTKEDIIGFTLLVEDLMDEILLKIQKSAEIDSFKS